MYVRARACVHAGMPICNAGALGKVPAVDMVRMTADVNKIVGAIARILVHVLSGGVSGEVSWNDRSSKQPQIF